MWTIIKKGTILPDDFLDMKNYFINHEKYVIEMGYEDQGWQDEYHTPVTPEIIGAILLGSDMYADIRFRQRTFDDKIWNKYDTLISRIMNTTLFD